MRRDAVTTFPVAVSVGASGAGTTTTGPVCGRVTEVRVGAGGASLSAGGSADWTITRLADGGTVFAAANVAAHQTFPIARGLVTTTAGTTAYSVGVGPVVVPGVPVDDHLVVTVAQAAPSASGTVYLTVES